MGKMKKSISDIISRVISGETSIFGAYWEMRENYVEREIRACLIREASKEDKSVRSTLAKVFIDMLASEMERRRREPLKLEYVRRIRENLSTLPPTAFAVDREKIPKMTINASIGISQAFGDVLEREIIIATPENAETLVELAKTARVIREMLNVGNAHDESSYVETGRKGQVIELNRKIPVESILRHELDGAKEKLMEGRHREFLNEIEEMAERNPNDMDGLIRTRTDEAEFSILVQICANMISEGYRNAWGISPKLIGRKIASLCNYGYSPRFMGSEDFSDIVKAYLSKIETNEREELRAIIAYNLRKMSNNMRIFREKYEDYARIRMTAAEIYLGALDETEEENNDTRTAVELGLRDIDEACRMMLSKEQMWEDVKRRISITLKARMPDRRFSRKVFSHENIKEVVRRVNRG